MKNQRLKTHQNKIFIILWVWIGFVSSFDTYWTVRLRDEMFHEEQNPIAREIMKIDDWDISLFIGLKMFFTILVLGLLGFLQISNKKLAFTAIFAICLFQTILFGSLDYLFEKLVLMNENIEEKNLNFAKEVKKHLEVITSEVQTYIIVVAIHKEFYRNLITKINCRKGLPIGGYVYDSQNDSYHINCVDYLHLGFIPFSFFVKIAGVEQWKNYIPVPETLIKKYLNPLQKNELKNFKNSFRESEFDIQFIQMIDANA